MPRLAQSGETAFDIQDLVQGALQLAVFAKRLREEAMEVLERYGKVNAGDLNTDVVIIAEAYKARDSIAVKALKLRDQMVSHLVELASVVPINREEFVKALNILYSLNPYELDSVLNTVANDSFIELYVSLVLSAMYSRTGTPPTPVFVPVPSVPLQGTEQGR